MWVLILLFALSTAILGWTLFGYFLALWFMGLFRRDVRPALPGKWPLLSVVVPCLDERERIDAKIANLSSLVYPRDCLEVVFVDGGSRDGTAAAILAAAAHDGVLRLVSSPVRGKVLQLNHVLPQLRGEIVVSTDVDACLEPDALQWLAAEFAASPDVGVVGAYCRPPEDAYDVERYYWDAQNRGRLIESRACSSSIVVAPCYAFRRELLTAFPADVVADDVYIAFLCNTLGHRVAYSRHASAVETRSPARLTEFLAHKFRKSNAFLLESLRFLYRLPDMSAAWKTMYLTRIAQQLFIPAALAAWLLIAASLVTLTPDPRFDVVGMGAAGLLVLLGLTSYAFRTVYLPEAGRYSAVTVAKGWILTTLLLAVTGLTYPFYRQDSVYARLRAAGAVGERRRSREGISISEPVDALLHQLSLRVPPSKPRLTLRLADAAIRSVVLRQPRLRYVDFSLDFKCNLHCEHCFATALAKPRGRRMVLEDYRRVSREAMALGAVNFSFQGGEPLMLDGLGDIVQACAPDRNVISVTTNGTLVTRERARHLRTDRRRHPHGQPRQQHPCGARPVPGRAGHVRAHDGRDRRRARRRPARLPGHRRHAAERPGARASPDSCASPRSSAACSTSSSRCRQESGRMRRSCS